MAALTPHAASGPANAAAANVAAADASGDASLRGVSIDFLVEFCWEHDCWTTPTREVVREVISPATSAACDGNESDMPYTALLPVEQVGAPALFLSHAWGQPFGLVVAAARKYVSSERDRRKRKQQQQQQQQKQPSANAAGGATESTVYCWVDIFAITQHPGESQAHDLCRLEATIANPECTTLMVLDASGAPLTRCWCIFEVYCTLIHALYTDGKLQVRLID